LDCVQGEGPTRAEGISCEIHSTCEGRAKDWQERQSFSATWLTSHFLEAAFDFFSTGSTAILRHFDA